MQIKHLQNKSIDYALWDKCISESINQLTYAYSWYLDIVSPNWEALVSENFDYIMPLPLKRKYKLPYIVQPKLTQQLGVFSNQVVDENIVQLFINELPSFSYELNLNEHNFFQNAEIWPNYVLDLNQSYQQIASKYSKNTKRNIEKATKMDLKVQYELSLDAFISFYYSANKKYKSADQSFVKELINIGISNEKMSLYAVLSAKNEIIAALCLLHSTNRLTYLLPVSNEQGKSSSAMFLLIDKLIQNNVEKNCLFDFEGSRIEGIARFYKGFGAINQPYYIIKRFRPEFLIGKFNNK
ncbi:MAG: peptidoglycan bridge formation glycyltransferase FemA/FemB family protein [Paludibacter sp.]